MKGLQGRNESSITSNLLLAVQRMDKERGLMVGCGLSLGAVFSEAQQLGFLFND